MKKCRNCKQLKDFSEFTKNAKSKDGKNINCKSCIRELRNNNRAKIKEYSDKYYQENKSRVLVLQKFRRKHNPENMSHIAKKARLKYNYNITLEQYNELFSQQNGMCAICRAHQSELSKSLYVDHDHKTGKIRGLLCHRCNVGLGMFQDSTEVLSEALSYLEK